MAFITLLFALYRGIIPAAMGNFVSHGVRTFSYEASFSALTAFTGGAAELQVRDSHPTTAKIGSVFT